jgi:3-oxoacyl-[acyl-carrier protein] reductase
MFDLAGRVALVTGSGQGVGAGIARALASRGAAVAVNDLVEDRALACAAAIEGQGGRAFAVAFDATDFDAFTAGVSAVEEALGPVGVLVNNAGVPPGMGFKAFRDTQPEEWRPYVDLNTYAVMNGAKAVIDGMCERGFGRVITISSGAGVIGASLGISPYAAGKGGGISFMRHLALETAGTGVTANTVALGLMNNQADPSAIAAIARTVPAKRLGEPADVGALCVYLASDESSWMTGQTLGLNGGSWTT